MKLKDEKRFMDYYELNDDPYGRGTMDFAVQWAELMEYLIEEGYELEEIYKIAESTIDKYYGITGFMYGMAVAILAEFWVHGEELRILHNENYGIYEDNDNGGVVNPAIITIG